MRTSNVDISKLPKFTSLEDAKSYFERYGKLTFWGWETPEMYAIYSYKRNNGMEYDIDIFPDGRVVVIQLGTDLHKQF